MQELLFLLLPLAAASGWYSGRRSRQQKVAGPAAGKAYFKGLDFLLNEQPDKAIDAFVELLEVDEDTVETHLALGTLFRRQGETDRAIRIHQGLIARPNLNGNLRSQALLELGRDYLKAGVFDRAIGLFEELLEQRLLQVPALRNLHKIYQATREWEKALQTALRLEELGEPSLRVERAHYLCEMALMAADGVATVQHLRQALSIHPQCVRASIVLGQEFQRRGDQHEAIKHFERVREQDFLFFGEVVRPLSDAMLALGQRERLQQVLRDAAERHGDTRALSALSALVREGQGDQAAVALVQNFLDRHPGLKGMQQLVDFQLASPATTDRDLLLLMQTVIRRMLDAEYPYRCRRCGFDAHQLHWQCPSCKGWGGMKPMSGSYCLESSKTRELLIDKV